MGIGALMIVGIVGYVYKNSTDDTSYISQGNGKRESSPDFLIGAAPSIAIAILSMFAALYTKGSYQISNTALRRAPDIVDCARRAILGKMGRYLCSPNGILCRYFRVEM